MTLPKECQTPEARRALADALGRAIQGALKRVDAGALRGCTVDELHRLPQTAADYKPALPHGAELDRRVKLARQGDKLAALEVHQVLVTDLRRGTLDARERELLASMHEATARGADPAGAMLLARPPNRRIKTRMAEFIAQWITLEIQAHQRIRAAGGAKCDNGCKALTNAAAYARAAGLFGISASRARAIHAGARVKPA